MHGETCEVAKLNEEVLRLEGEIRVLKKDRAESYENSMRNFARDVRDRGWVTPLGDPEITASLMGLEDELFEWTSTWAIRKPGVVESLPLEDCEQIERMLRGHAWTSDASLYESVARWPVKKDWVAYVLVQALGARYVFNELIKDPFFYLQKNQLTKERNVGHSEAFPVYMGEILKDIYERLQRSRLFGLILLDSL